MEIEELIEGCLRGEQESWEKLLEAYGPFVKAVTGRLISRKGIAGAESDLDQICSDVFVSLVEKDCHLLRSYDRNYAFTTWLGVLANTAVSRYIRRSGKKQKEVKVEVEALEYLISDTSSQSDEAVSEAEKEERKDIVHTALGKLSLRERVMVKMFYFDELSHEEIASVMGVSPGSVPKMMARVREKLLESLRARSQDIL